MFTLLFISAKGLRELNSIHKRKNWNKSRDSVTFFKLNICFSTSCSNKYLLLVQEVKNNCLFLLIKWNRIHPCMPDTSPPQAGINVLWGGGKEKVPSFNNFVSINMGGVQGISIFPGFYFVKQKKALWFFISLKFTKQAQAAIYCFYCENVFEFLKFTPFSLSSLLLTKIFESSFLVGFCWHTLLSYILV